MSWNISLSGHYEDGNADVDKNAEIERVARKFVAELDMLGANVQAANMGPQGENRYIDLRKEAEAANG